MASRRIRRTKSLAGYTAAVYQDLIDLKTRNNPRSIAASAIDGGSLAGEIELINKSLQSANYMPGVDGWKIDGSGNAEFGNVYVRGDINAYSGTIGYWNISNPSVERTFGDTTLFGTFLESFDHGFTDDGATIGTYVSLFKSYIDVPTVITKISVTSDIVTITAPDHNFIVGDKIVVEFDDAAYSAYESSTYLTVTERTPDTFSYVKLVANSGEAGNTVPEIEASGLAQIYNEDIAGLYLRDYAKTSFDYGFFSNKGIAYTSAEVLNLVYNPSFEYKISGTNTYSNAGWSATSGITQKTFSSTGYRYSSEFGASIAWTSSARTDYLIANVDYNAGVDYKIFDTSNTLYLGFDVFPAEPLAPVAVSSATASTSNTVTVVTSASHTLVAGDYVYLNFTAIDANGLDYSSDDTYYLYGPKVFEVLSNVNATAFTITNFYSTAGGALTLSSTPQIYPKVISPALDLSEIKIKFGSDETTVLANVLTDTYKSTFWDLSSENKKLSISATEIVENSINGTIPPMKTRAGVPHVELDSAKIKDFYSTLDPTGFANANTFQILIPTWLYKKNLSGATQVTKLLNTNYTIDNVYLSESNKFFYADSSTTSHSWYTLGTGNAAPEQVSVESPKQWIDLDLDSQTFELDYVDKVGFESPTYYQSLLTRASISMVQDSDRDSFTYTDYLSPREIPVSDSNTLSVTSGKVQYISGSSTIKNQSYLNVSTNLGRTGAELVSVRNVTGLINFDRIASISSHVDSSGRSLIGLQSDYIVARSSGYNGADIAKFVTPTGSPALHAAYVTNNTNDSTSGGTNHIVYELETADETGITSETFAAGSTPCIAYFTTGPSGVVEIHVYADYQNTSVASGTGLSFVSFQIADAATLTTQIDATTSRSIIRSGTLRESGTVFYIYAGSPNTRYRIRTMHRTTTGATLSIFNRSIMVIPIT